MAASERLRTSQRTVLEPRTGGLEQARIGQRAFQDSEAVIGRLPEAFLGRRFILADRDRVEAVCRQPGTAYAVVEVDGIQARGLLDAGFRPLQIPEFQVFRDDPTLAAAYQKDVTAGEELAFDGWVLVIFGPSERGGVPDSQMQSLVPPALLPDGSEFKTWEVPQSYSTTLHVDQAHPEAADTNPGTETRPLKTIGRAAELLEPGQRVVVGAGVYREWVRPRQGGTDPDHMITYEAAPGADVVISGAEILDVEWVPSAPYAQDMETPVEPTVERIWMARLPADRFPGYNPFGVANYRLVGQMTYWKVSDLFKNPNSHVFLQTAGLLFQDGRRLEQVDVHTELFTREGSFWVESSGTVIHVSPYGDADPNLAEWEATAREQIFAPTTFHLGYIAVKGFTMAFAGNSFPFPQHGALSTSMGHHWLIEGNTVRWANSVGIDIGNQGYPPIRRPEIMGYHVVRGNTLEDIGITGLTGPSPHDTLIEDNLFRRNAWHDVESMAELGAIKTHQNQNVLIRRNLVIDTVHGTGIYVDYENSNTRICQNVVIASGTNNGPGPGTGGIYVEHAMDPVMVDHNVVWGSTETNGIYSYQATSLTVAHNLVGGCRAGAILVLDVPGRGNGSGGNRIVNNVVVGNGWNAGLYSTDNVVDHNLYGHAGDAAPFHLGLAKENDGGFPPPRKGRQYARTFDIDGWRAQGFDRHGAVAAIQATFDPATLELAWSASETVAEGDSVFGCGHDFWGRPSPQPSAPGPFGEVPVTTSRIVVDPRPTTSPDRRRPN
jgi:hypothetical protein